MSAHVITVTQQKGGSGKTTLAANLAVSLAETGAKVAIIDSDPQGSLAWWYSEREKTLDDPGLEVVATSAWGLGYEVGRLKREADFVLIDTPPKADSDLRPAIREADLVLIPVSASPMDLWATQSTLDLAARERVPTLLVLNRLRNGTRVAAEMAEQAAGLGSELASAALGNRVIFARNMGRGLTGADAPARDPARGEVAALRASVLAAMGLGASGSRAA